MIKLVFIVVLAVHGLVHLVGFSNAFHYSKDNVLTGEISKAAGISWLLTSVLFIVSAVLLLMNNGLWWVAALLADILSQLLIIKIWKDAWPGTIANILILAAIFILK